MAYKFVGENSGDQAGIHVASAGDVDGDGVVDLLIGAHYNDSGGSNAGATYLMTAADLAAADAADGVVDGVIDLSNIAPQSSSYKFIGEDGGDFAGVSVSTAGDIDGDGKADLLIGASGGDGGGSSSGETYLMTASDLAAADAADGSVDGVIDFSNVAAQSTSYKFYGASSNDNAGISVSSVGDIDGDNLDDFIIGAENGWGGGGSAGEAYLVSAAELAAADAADGTVDGNIDLGNIAAQTDSYLFIGEHGHSGAGTVVAGAGDVDGDGVEDLLIGAPFADERDDDDEAGAVYLVTASDLAAADAADGSVDGEIDLGNIAAQSTSYKFYAEDEDHEAGISLSSAGDVDGDGQADILIGADEADGPNGNSSGLVYLVNADDLAAADAADGDVDGEIDLGNIAAQTSSYRFAGEDSADEAGAWVETAGDVDGDGKADILIGADDADGGGSKSGEVYLVAATDLAAIDLADGSADGEIDLANVAAVAGASYKFIGEAGGDEAGTSVASAGDVDGDGKDDILIGAIENNSGGNDAGAVYLIHASELAIADAADGTVDHIIHLDSLPPCFVRGTLIDTPEGQLPVERLKSGDAVKTADRGAQTIRWIGSTTSNGTRHYAPVCIKQGAMGKNAVTGQEMPSRDLRVSPQHRMLMSGWRAELLFGTSEVLAPARHLTNGDTIYSEPSQKVEYWHILFDRHEVVYAEGAPSESFHPGELVLNAMGAAARAEIFALFPQLEGNGEAYGTAARLSLKSRETGLLLGLVPQGPCQ